MTTATIPTDDPKVDRAQKERERRTKKKEEAAAVIAAAAKNYAPEIKAPFYPRAVLALEAIVGRKDPIAFAFDGAAPEVLDGRDARDVLLAWIREEIPSSDPAAQHLRAMAVRVKKDQRTPLVSGRPDLWGRKVGALLAALADARA